MTAARSALIVDKAMRWGFGWFTRGGLFEDRAERAPREVLILRVIGVAYLVAFVVVTLTTSPRPALHGRGLVVALATAGFVLALLSRMSRISSSPRRWLPVVTIVLASSAVLAATQPTGLWAASPYFIAVFAALKLERGMGALLLLVSIGVVDAGAAIGGHSTGAIPATVGAVPWFLIVRLLRESRERQQELELSRVAEARAAAAAERGRLAREMHDVLAHSLSALALQLESTRLLARDRGADPDVSEAIDQAHHVAAGGLEEARRAIAAARGDELVGPERLGALARAFGNQSGLPVAVEVHGEPRELAADARLAVYRTAQEALTNVRRHAAAERVEVELDYRDGSTVLVVEDHASAGAPAPVAVATAGGGFGLTGMRERAELLGGSLTAEPTDDGFRVELWLPV